MNARILVPVAVGAAINLVHAVPKGHNNVVRVGIGNVALALILSGMAEANEDLAATFAVVYLIGSALVNGRPFIEWFDVVIGQGGAGPTGTIQNLPTYSVPTQKGYVNA